MAAANETQGIVTQVGAQGMPNVMERLEEILAAFKGNTGGSQRQLRTSSTTTAVCWRLCVIVWEFDR